MFRLTLIVITALLLVLPIAGRSQHVRKQPQKRHIGGGESGGTPNEDSLLYKYTRGLARVDRVEISEVRFAPAATNGGSETKIIKSVAFQGVEAEKFASVWRDLNGGTGAGCFSPAYLVKFYFDERLLLGSTICFHCHNLTLPVGETIEIHSFDADGPTGQRLLKTVQDALANSSASSYGRLPQTGTNACL
ncbi:MAG: hypothetical protein ND895_24260 [Pyrinomonadaceae bacterium]|nr:hypothetical protein [Pyrinomonadaceae bacterium]